MLGLNTGQGGGRVTLQGAGSSRVFPVSRGGVFPGHALHRGCLPGYPTLRGTFTGAGREASSSPFHFSLTCSSKEYFLGTCHRPWGPGQEKLKREGLASPCPTSYGPKRVPQVHPGAFQGAPSGLGVRHTLQTQSPQSPVVCVCACVRACMHVCVLGVTKR